MNTAASYPSLVSAPSAGDTDLGTRSNRAVLAKIPWALARITEQLDESGLGGILELEALEPEVRSRLALSFGSEGEAGGDPDVSPLLELGADDSTSPDVVAYERVCWALEQVMRDMVEALGFLHTGGEKRFASWIRRNVRTSAAGFDPATLRIVATAPPELELLGLARQVLEYEPDRLGEIVEKLSEAADGADAFIRDLGAARLSSPALEGLLRRVWALEDPDAVEEVAQAPLVLRSGHAKPIGFLAQLLKGRLALAPALRAQLDRKIGRSSSQFVLAPMTQH